MKAIVLAAGKGTRLQSEKANLPKVMRLANNRPLIDYCLDSINFIEAKDTHIVVGYMRDKIMEHLGSDYNFAVQEQQLGTGHAVMSTYSQLEEYQGDILVIYGDMPLIKKETFESLVAEHKKSSADLTILTAEVKNILPYGRIIRNEEGKIVDIIEEKDASEDVKKINELNVGVIVAKSQLLFKALKGLKNDNTAGEYYLTDATGIFVKNNWNISSYKITNEAEIRGVNTLEDLRFVEENL